MLEYPQKEMLERFISEWCNVNVEAVDKLDFTEEVHMELILKLII